VRPLESPAAGHVVSFTLLALRYLEQIELVPQRFVQAGFSAWHGVMPYLRDLDLFELAVRDGARANPHLFAAFRDLTAHNELRALDERAWEQELQRLQSLDLTGLSPRELYRRGAATLGIQLTPLNEAALQGDAFDRSSLIAELPNGCGYPSLLLCGTYGFLDPAHNLRLFVDGTEAEMLAAWALVLLTRQLTLPAGRIVPISATDYEALSRETFDAALVYRPVEWLPSDLSQVINAREVIHL